MPHFAYQGRNARGELVQGVLEGASSGAVADQLFSTGITPVDIDAAAAPAPPRATGGAVADAASASRSVELDGPDAVQPPDAHAAQGRRADHARRWPACRNPPSNPTLARRPRATCARASKPGASCRSAMRQHPQGVLAASTSAWCASARSPGGSTRSSCACSSHLEFEKMMREQIKAALRYPTVRDDRDRRGDRSSSTSS